MYGLLFKRLIDIGVSLFLLVILFPLLVVVAVLISIFNSGSPFFFQKRPGKDSKVFSVIKFRTMNDKHGKDGKLLPDSQRLTSLGKLVRSTSIDELPQLVNVLIGQMSLIGPRPLLIKYLPLYSPRQMRRHEVRPGITGWAQVNGRNAISWEEKFELDVWYVDNVSFLLDFRVLVMTFLKVIKRTDINSNAAATMHPFQGSSAN